MQTIQENILDVTLLEPQQKHPAIFARFDELIEGQSLTILNDHDPKPLYYQLLEERGNIFKWEYLEQGPQWWKVLISKNIAGTNEETLGEIVAKDLRKAQVFKKYGLDFCCGGKKTVKQACAEKGIDLTKIEYELQQTDIKFDTRPLPYNDWSLDFLIDYIVNVHHSYVNKSLPEILTYATKVAQVHGNSHPELPAIHQLVKEINAELTAHLVNEEKVLFPYIKDMVASKKRTEILPPSSFSTVQNPIHMMELEHETVGNNLGRIRALSNNYALPGDACASYSLLYRMLDEFEADLHTHIHLENNILFPKALAFEKNKQ